MCVLDLARVNTNPGVDPDDPYCPPAGFAGGSAEYLALLRERSKDPMHGQRMLVAAHYAARPASEVQRLTEIRGPFAREAEQTIAALNAMPIQLSRMRAANVK